MIRNNGKPRPDCVLINEEQKQVWNRNGIRIIGSSSFYYMLYCTSGPVSDYNRGYSFVSNPGCFVFRATLKFIKS